MPLVESGFWSPLCLKIVSPCCFTVKTILKDERKYYEDLLKYSREHLMLYPYHLSDVIVKGLRVTPFSYYTNVMADIMSQEKSYDSLPNFTAADCMLYFGYYVKVQMVYGFTTKAKLTLQDLKTS